jgi:hypothetical protein
LKVYGELEVQIHCEEAGWGSGLDWVLQRRKNLVTFQKRTPAFQPEAYSILKEQVSETGLFPSSSEETLVPTKHVLSTHFLETASVSGAL